MFFLLLAFFANKTATIIARFHERNKTFLQINLLHIVIATIYYIYRLQTLAIGSFSLRLLNHALNLYSKL